MFVDKIGREVCVVFRFPGLAKSSAVGDISPL